MIERLILIRHGETVHNVAGIAQGWNDSALSEKGERQVAALAKRLEGLHVSAIVSSPIGRALTTAERIGEACSVPVQTIDDLREMSYGRWEGQSFLDVRKNDLPEYESWIADPESPAPGGESHQDVFRRMENAFRTIEESGAGGTVAVVTHGTAIRIAATVLLELPILSSRNLAQDNASVNVFVRRAPRWVLKLWNDTSHCP